MVRPNDTGRRQFVTTATALAIGALAGCTNIGGDDGGSDGTTMDESTDEMMNESTDEMMNESTDEMMNESTDEMMNESTDEMMGENESER